MQEIREMTPEEERELVDEEVVLNLALAQSQELFRERVRAEFLYLMNTDTLFKSEIQRGIKSEMYRYKRNMAHAISQAFDSLIDKQ
jgi:hypothetical protein